MSALLRFGFALTLSIVTLTGCSTTPRQADGGAVGERAAKHALAMQGKPYRYGGSTPNGFDCSGLVQYSYGRAGARLPRSTEGLWDSSRTVSQRQTRPGDLLFFTQEGKRSSHVGIYLGNDRFVHAPSSGKRVGVASLTDPYWRRHFEGARRPRLD
jgi:cell wall-associated NlpC family hydrolase